MPPKAPNIARFETGRSSRLYLPLDTCPNWFKSDLDVLFVPLCWKDDLQLPSTRLLEALLISAKDKLGEDVEWSVFPTSVSRGQQEFNKPEEQKLSSLIYESKLILHKGEWRLNCPPMLKGLCDQERRVYVTEHSLGVSMWSPPAFNEHFGK